MSKYIIIDMQNLFFRCKYVTRGDTDTKIGMTMHIILNSILKTWKKFNADHVVFCIDGKSWRKEYHPEYKMQRKVKDNLKSESEKEEDKQYLEALNDMIEFIDNKTNSTLLRSYNLEADDLIAMWCDIHDEDDHIIISSDKDFIQLVSSNIKLYDGIKDQLYTIDGIYDNKDNLIVDKKSNIPKRVNPEWELFKKIIRGDSSDNIFSAYPGVRENKIKKAFDDKTQKGYDWNNFMLSTWEDSDGNTQKVLDRYNFNKMLIDLREQPEYIKEEGANAIITALNKDNVSYVGVHFLKFCQKWELIAIQNFPDEYANFFNAKYYNSG